jgi:hypothetical protein
MIIQPLDRVVVDVQPRRDPTLMGRIPMRAV